MKLRRMFVLIAIVTCCAPLTRAQSDDPKTEVFLGASVIAAQNALTNKDIVSFDGITPAQFRAVAGFELLDEERYVPGYGFEANVTRYFTKHVGISGEVAGYYVRGRNFRIADTLFKADHSIHYFLAGPQAKFFNEHRANVFVHAVGGAARTSVSFREANATSPVTAKDSSTRLAFAFGGGVDVRVSRRISARIFQLDWVPMLGKDRRVTASDGTVVDIMGRAQQGNFRVSAGIVIK